MEDEYDKENDAIFESNLSGFIRFVLDAACSEMKMDIKTMKTGETASKEEWTEVFRKIRQSEDNQVVEYMQNDENRDLPVKKEDLTKEEETAGDEERIAYFRTVRQSEYDRLIGALGQGEIEERKNELEENQEETTSEEERKAFFKTVRDTEYKKLLEAVEHERLRAAQNFREKLAKHMEDFLTEAVDTYSTTGCEWRENEQRPLQNSFNQEASTSTDETYSRLRKTPDSTPFLSSEDSTDTPYHRQYFDTTYSPLITKEVFSPMENRKLFLKTESEVEIKRHNSLRRLVNKVFQRSKSVTNDFGSKQKDLKDLQNKRQFHKNVNEKEAVTVKAVEISKNEWEDLSDVEETPRPRIRPYFQRNEDTIPNEPVNAEKRTSRNIFVRIRQWYRKLSCCCCHTEDVIV